MIYINLSYFDSILGPETLCTVPSTPEEDIAECTNSLLNISEFIDLKFFVYVSSEHFKTSNVYTKIPSEWARGGVEMLLISVILVNEGFSRLHLFEEVLEKIVNSINHLDEAYKAFYSRDRNRNRPEIDENDAIIGKKEEMIALLNENLPEIHRIIEAAKKIPLDSEIIETEENLQDEFAILKKDDTALEAAKALAARPQILIGVVLENNKPIGILDEDDILNRVLLKGKDPILVKVQDIMTRKVTSVDANDPIDGVIELMIDKGLKAVPILQNNEFYGVFTITDAASHNKNILELIGQRLQDISEHNLEDIKNLQLKLWSYIRNISRNRKIMEFQTNKAKKSVKKADKKHN